VPVISWIIDESKAKAMGAKASTVEVGTKWQSLVPSVTKCEKFKIGNMDVLRCAGSSLRGDGGASRILNI